MKRFNNKKDKEVDEPKSVADFLKAISNVCFAHGFSISHEDGHGGFLIEKYSESNIEWLNDASINF